MRGVDISPQNKERNRQRNKARTKTKKISLQLTPYGIRVPGPDAAGQHISKASFQKY
jgi:hypothetical protein